MNKNTRMRHFTLMGILCLLLSFTGSAQSVRTVTGAQNNLQYPSWGAANTTLRRLASPAYPDGVSAISGADRPNPRTISNEIFAQPDLIEDPMNLSDFCWVWGQFLDHDLTLVFDDPNAWSFISVPAGDPWMDPFGSGQAMIPMRRSAFAPGTGTDTSNPAQHRNEISAFVDASNVYGSDQHRADWLRTFEGGKLKTSAGNLLPYNTTTGEYDDPVDHDAPEMDDAVGMATRLFVAGDIRANENPLLLSLHTLFVREHNRLCDELTIANPTWDDEALYQHARRMVIGYMSAILYEQWLPAMGVHLPAYTGYDPFANPTISNMFSAAAFRLGHTLLNSNIKVMDNDGNDVMPLSLREAFFNPEQLTTVGDIDPFLKGMGAQMQQACDSKMVDDVRNFLFGPPGAGGLDLAAINIQRGRERGIPAFNVVRASLGKQPLPDFAALTQDPVLQDKLTALYGSIDELDPWVGMLVETPMPSALFGETIMAAMLQQFIALRNGDRFYYENDNALSAAEKADIRATMFRDIIQRNTDITLMQEDVFLMMPHEMLCAATVAQTDLTGTVQTDIDEAINGVSLTITETLNQTTLFDGEIDGTYLLSDAPTCEAYELSFSRPDAITNGVTALDIVALRKHILNLQPLSTPERLIAADLNASGSLSTLDMVQLRKAILGIITEWEYVPTWRFYRADTPLPANEGEVLTMGTDFGTTFTINSLTEQTTLDVRGIKMGDLNGSANVDNLGEQPTAEGRGAPVTLSLSAASLQVGEVRRVVLTADQPLLAFQGNLQYDTDRIEVRAIHATGSTAFDATHYYHQAETGVLSFVYDHVPGTESDQLFVLEIEALGTIDVLTEVIRIGERHTPGMAIATDGSAYPVVLGSASIHAPIAEAILYQNTPNPAAGLTTISYYLPEAGTATLRLLDAAGREVQRTQQVLGAGRHEWALDAAALQSGLYFYQLQTAGASLTKRLVVR